MCEAIQIDEIYDLAKGVCVFFCEDTPISTPPTSNIDTKNDGLENVSPFTHGYFFGVYVKFQGP